MFKNNTNYKEKIQNTENFINEKENLLKNLYSLFEEKKQNKESLQNQYNDNYKKIKTISDKEQIKKIKKENEEISKKINTINSEQLKLSKEINPEQKKLNKARKVYDNLTKPKNDFDHVWKVATFISGFGFILMLFIFAILSSDLLWMGASFVLLFMFLILVFFLIFLAKKTHAILEFKSIVSKKPLCLFFTDHKRVDWKVIEPNAGIIEDKKYGAFLVNDKGSYVDTKTSNVLIPFNPSVASNAPMEAFKLSGALGKVFKDEKYLQRIRKALAAGEYDGEKIVLYNEDGTTENITDFDMIRESVDFSYLKSMMNTILPHHISSKIEMQVKQRMSGMNKVNVAHIVTIIVSIIGATVLAAILLSSFGSDGGTTTVIEKTVSQAAQNASSGGSING